MYKEKNKLENDELRKPLHPFLILSQLREF